LDFFAKGESHGGSWDEGKKSSVGETQGRQRKKECFLAKRYSVAPDFSLLFFSQVWAWVLSVKCLVV
jgi:hypothetical protein